MPFIEVSRGEDPSVIWTPRINTDVNNVLADNFKSYTTSSGIILLNDSSKEGGGGDISAPFAIPPGAAYFGHDITMVVPAVHLPHVMCNEFDLKITTADTGAQANISVQQVAQNNWAWQLGSGAGGWADSGFNPGSLLPDVPNTLQVRSWTDGNTWSFLGLRMNGGTPFTPGPEFVNLPMISTNWSKGLLKQLQCEVLDAPWLLVMLYTKVWIMASDEPIPWEI